MLTSFSDGFDQRNNQMLNTLNVDAIKPNEIVTQSIWDLYYYYDWGEHALFPMIFILISIDRTHWCDCMDFDMKMKMNSDSHSNIVQ